MRLSLSKAGDPMNFHQDFAAALETVILRIREIQTGARQHGFKERPVWAAMVLRTPKGWTGPKVVDGVLVEGTFRAHQVPLSNVRDNQAHMKLLEEWMRSYKPEELFDQNGTNTCGSLTCAETGIPILGYGLVWSLEGSCLQLPA
jgi:xylulose-5-phosphate/fructose-6-phosphate phosphoketolase